MAKAFLHTCTVGSLANRKAHIQPLLHLGKWALARDGTKFTSICRDTLYTNLYGSHTLAYWAEKDNTPKDPKRILWEESRLAMKRTSGAHRRIDTKLLSNECRFNKTIFDRRQQDTHTCPVCSAPKEDRNHIFTCQGQAVVKNREKNLKELKKELEDLETAPMITKTIIGRLRNVHNDTTPSIYSFGNSDFGGGITIRSIIEDQADIGWTNFLCGRWGVKWKEAQKSHTIYG